MTSAEDTVQAEPEIGQSVLDCRSDDLGCGQQAGQQTQLLTIVLVHPWSSVRLLAIPKVRQIERHQQFDLAYFVPCAEFARNILW